MFEIKSAEELAEIERELGLIAPEYVQAVIDARG
jgi:hypothetical protein